MKRINLTLIYWIMANLVWWFIDIVSGFGFGFDILPGFTNEEEVLINALIFTAGVSFYVFYYLTVAVFGEDDGDSDE